MDKRSTSLSSDALAPSSSRESASMPLVEDLARREKTPFVMTSIGRRAKNVFGADAGQTMFFSPDEPR